MRYDSAERCVDAHLAYLRSLGEIDEKFVAAAAAAVERVYAENCVEEQPGKFRCPLSGKLFREPKFVHQHISNKHGDKLVEGKRAALEAKFQAYYRAAAERMSAMPPAPPPPPRFPRDYGKGGGKGGGKGFGGKGGMMMGGKGLGGGPPIGRGGGRPPPPPENAEVIKRPVVTYKDLDAPDDDELFS